MAEKYGYAEEDEDEEDMNLLANIFVGEGNRKIWNRVSVARGEGLFGGTYKLSGR